MTAQSKTQWLIDAGHSSVQFKVKHLGIANIMGSFTKVEGTVLSVNEDFAGAEIRFSLDAGSITTNNAQRDGHLRGDMFLDTAQYPEITFAGLLEKNGSGYVLSGSLTIRGIAKEIRLPAEFTGTGKGRWDDTRAGFAVSGKINRKDYGIAVDILTGTGSLVVGEDVSLYIDAELIRQ